MALTSAFSLFGVPFRRPPVFGCPLAAIRCPWSKPIYFRPMLICLIGIATARGSRRAHATAGKIEALEGEEGTASFFICPILITRSQGFGRDELNGAARARTAQGHKYSSREPTPALDMV